VITPRKDPEIRLRRYWEDPDTPIVTAGLSALSVGYRAALAVREAAYRFRVLRTGRLACPVISVGNITVGGSGKTPLAELAARTLVELGGRPAVVSRGYGRDTRGVHVVADREGIRLEARAAGDEPRMLAERLPGVPVVVGENRLAAGKVAVERCGATVVVLDDGFQHRTIAKDLEIVVVNGRMPWGNGRLFPRGMLREPLSALARADLVVATNPAGPADVEAVTRTLRRHNDRAPVLAAAYEVIEASELGSGRRVGVDELAGRRLLAFAGLGTPRGFADTLAATGIRAAGLVEFPDHHWFLPDDLAGLARQSVAAGAQGLITTEKDAARLRGLPLPETPLWVLSVRLRLLAGTDLWREALGRTLSPQTAPRP
jgi:tetraacyldisaccharide 4'-kinase